MTLADSCFRGDVYPRVQLHFASFSLPYLAGYFPIILSASRILE